MTMQHPVPERLLARIGDITVSFALLESVLQSLIWTLLGGGQRTGQAVTAEISFRGLRALAVSLCLERYDDGEELATLRSLCGRAANAEEERNQITHSVWGAGDSRETITRVKTTAKEKHGLRFVFVGMGEPELAAIAERIMQLAYDVDHFHLTLAGA